MLHLKHFYEKTLKYDLANKFLYTGSKKLPELKKIIINYACKNAEIKQLSSSLLALELMANQKGIITTTKKPNIQLKIRKGNPVGCKITLRKACMFNFFSKITAEVYPKIKNIRKLSAKLKKNTFSYQLDDPFVFPELEEHYYLFNNLPNLSITIVTNCTSKEEFAFLLKSLNLYLIANITQW